MITLALLLACAPEPSSPPASAPASEPEAAPLPAHRVFPSAAEAVRYALASQPRVVGVGEVHATTDGPQVPTTISRFTQEILPLLAPSTTDLVIETWRLDSACGPQAEQVVVQVEVDTKRPEETKSEIVVLAERALALGVRPHDLVLTCAEYAPLSEDSGEIDYDALLTLLTTKLDDYVQRGLESSDARVVLYGGAMHNDLHPREGMESWSYGVAAAEKGGAQYVELDLYQPELLLGKDALVEPEWAPLLERAVGPDRAVLYERGPGSFVVLMETAPRSPRVFLYTMGHDDELATRYGHAALCVRPEGGQAGTCWAYGYTDFSDVLAVILRMSRGQGEFWGDVEDEGELLARYVQRDSDIWRQELPLTEAQALDLRDRLRASLAPESRIYSYHHFYDNCATRLRDPLDQATGGRLREGAQVPDGPPLREFAEAGLGGILPLQIMVQLGVGRDHDRPSTAWDRMGLPSELRDQVQRAYGAVPERLNTRQGPPIPDAPRLGRHVVGAAGLVFAAALAGLARARRDALWRAGGLMLGLPALIPWGVSLVATIPDLRWNESLLLCWPTDLLLHRLSPDARRRYLSLRLGVLGVAAALWVAGVLIQPHLPTLLLVGLPLLVLRAAAGRR